jgi:predicted phage terminase large subunit-like protein
MAACPTDAPHIRGRFEELGVPTTTTKWDMTFGTKGLMVKLREIGVLNNKHIPPEYLMASVEQRMELLRGLIDTDGDVTKDGKVTFNGSNRILVEGVLELLHSLGVKAQITERHTSYKGYETRLSFRIMFKLKGAASLPRKAERTKDMEGNKARTISVELGGRGDVQCIEVEREDGLFLAGKGYVLTHNCKSEATSWLFPSWMMGKNPNLKILHISHTDGLVSQFGGWVRDLIATPKYQSVYPSTKLKKDKKATGQWHTDKGGEYYGAGTGGAIAGHGGDLIIVDDPHSEQDTSDKAFEDASVWFQDGVRQREQAGAAIVLVMTRWSQRDLTASILAKAKETGEYWKVIEFPAMNEEGTEVLWPEKWSLNAMLMKKASLSVKSWTATYLQKPVAGEASIIKEEWWNNWNGDHLRSPSNKGGYPNFNYILQSWDCADTDGAKSNPSACTTWGIFDRYDPIQDQTVACAFLLDAFAKKMLWPELKKKARELYDLYKSDLVLIEAKSAGRALASELSMMGIPVMENKVTRSSGNKIVRVNQIADIFASGRVFAYTSHRYAQEVITEMSAFPHGLTDDLTDTVSQALSHMREGMMIGTENDRWGNSSDEDNKPRDRNVAYY